MARAYILVVCSVVDGGWEGQVGAERNQNNGGGGHGQEAHGVQQAHAHPDYSLCAAGPAEPGVARDGAAGDCAHNCAQLCAAAPRVCREEEGTSSC